MSDAVLRLYGDVDFFKEDEFRREAEQLLSGEGVTGLVVDLTDVTMVDSSGLGLLVDVLRLCRDTELPMRLRNVPPNVVRLLELTGLGELMPIEAPASGAD